MVSPPPPPRVALPPPLFPVANEGGAGSYGDPTMTTQLDQCGRRPHESGGGAVSTVAAPPATAPTAGCCSAGRDEWVGSNSVLIQTALYRADYWCEVELFFPLRHMEGTAPAFEGANILLAENRDSSWLGSCCSPSVCLYRCCLMLRLSCVT